MGKTTTEAKKETDEYFKYLEIQHKIAHMTGMVYIKKPDRAEMELVAEVAGYEREKAAAEGRKAWHLTAQNEWLATRGSELAVMEKTFAEKSALLAKEREEARVGSAEKLNELQTLKETYLQKEGGTAKALSAISAKKPDITSVKPYLKSEDLDAILANLNSLIRAKRQTSAKGAKSSSSKQKSEGGDLEALNKEQDTIYRIRTGELRIEAGKSYLSNIVAQMKARLNSELKEDRLAVESLERDIAGLQLASKQFNSTWKETMARADEEFAGHKKPFEEERRLLQATIDLEQSLADRYGRLLTSILQQERMAVAEAFLTEDESDPSQTKHTHVEALLIKKLREATSARIPFDRIPERSTIVFYIDQSPCTNCIESVLPPFLEELGILRRNIRVRFRFARYYVKESATDPIRIKWDTDGEAQEKYDEFAYGYGLTETSSGSEFPAFKPKVAILPAKEKGREFYSDIYRLDT